MTTNVTSSFTTHAGDTPSPLTVTSLDRFFVFLGPLKKYLDNDSVTGLHVNADGSIFVNEFGRGVYRAPESIGSEENDGPRAALISWLASETGYGRAVDHLHSRLQCDAPHYGSRVQAFAPPIANWVMIWRQHRKHVFALEDYLEKGEMTKAQFDFIVEAIRAEKNLGIAGSTDSGKTTLMNAALAKKAEIYPDLRAIVVQDRKEVRADDFKNKLFIMARIEQAHHDAGKVSRYTYEFSDALEDALRSDVGFLVWGEVRDGLSATGLMLAVNTGSKGLIYTSHANSARDLPVRLEDLVRLNRFDPRPRMIATMNEAIVFMEKDRTTQRRRVVEGGYVTGVDASGRYQYERQV